MQRNNFFEQVYEIVKRISVGKVMTYGQIAELLGTRDARRVGHALHANRSSEVPCHRVVNKDGRLAPSYAFGGPNEQRSRLLSEGVKFVDENHVKMD
ncbi:MAG: methylated-DNA-protein-cysteine methyltransferase [Candidatus Woesebacteria bacterium GW2011_GWB1_45_5]|uniref:Methylated-DNA-protein-cysteine methyltransferase n=1 Tax=Candidatus Woesebacteria bacterium GW2011_GWB1_45_5 TaxID=1618581 RepID=A0A0G1MP73_9BACT|nr:MAG: methylated-DNA-protein-cysteine methyltransferase [Candidatus Woesebacteria bacterium GW2011_GWB1_45_5]